MDKEILLGWLAGFGGWLLDNSLVLAQVLAALVTAVATIALWRVTRVLAVETTNLARMTSRPFVVCWLESSGASANALNLTLRNTGNATAFDIQLKISPALPKPSGEPPDNPEETAFETSLLPPGQLLSIQGVLGREVFKKIYTAHISWSGSPNAIERETLTYRFEPKDGFRGGWNTKGAHQIAEELEKIRKQLPRP